MDEQLGLIVVIVLGLLLGAATFGFGWFARGAHDDAEFNRVTARMCQEGIACFGDRG